VLFTLRLLFVGPKKSLSVHSLAISASLSSSMANPLLSIVTVCFNSEATICETIRSVKSCMSSNLEYIIVDGGSTDSTLSIIRNHLDCIDSLISETDEGIFDAMNKGLSAASGEYVAFLNSDDVYLPGAIAALLAAISSKRSDVDVFYGDWIALRQNGTLCYQNAFHSLRLKYSLCHQAIAMRRTIFPTPFGFDQKYRFCSDFDLILRLQQDNARFYHLSLPIVRFSESGSSLQYFRRSAYESIVIAISRGRFPWSFLFATRVFLYAFKMTLISLSRVF